MDSKKLELNHEINMQYRQLGKELFNDLDKEKFNITKYRRRAKKINVLINQLMDFEERFEHVAYSAKERQNEEAYEEINEEELELKVTDDGFTMYRFCPECNAGNHPDAKRCVRCKEVLS